KRFSSNGTPLYMAPEQSHCLLMDYDTKVDVFALGLILAELCFVLGEHTRDHVFYNLRFGIPNGILSDHPDIANCICNNMYEEPPDACEQKPMTNQHKSEISHAPFDMTVCNFVRRLWKNEYFCQLENGLSLSFANFDGLCEVYTNSGYTRDRSSYATNSRVGIKESVKFAGELSNVVFFYSETQIQKKIKYTFYASRHINSGQLTSGKLRDISVADKLHFAVQQPFFLSSNDQTAESFFGEKFELKTKIGDDQAFFFRRNCVFVVTREANTPLPTANLFDNIVIVTLPMSYSLPQSIYGEDDPFLFLLCGNQLMIMQDTLEISTICIDGFNTLSSSLGGISDNGDLLINVHDGGYPSYNMLLAMNFEDEIFDSDFTTTVTNSNDEPALNEKEALMLPKLESNGIFPARERKIHYEMSEEDLAQALYQSTVEAQISELHDTVKKLTSDVNRKDAEITRLRDELTLSNSRMHQLSFRNLPQASHHDFTSKFSNEFEVQQILGAGSFGMVFKAVNTFDEFAYAVKRIPVEALEKHVAKALREVRAMAQLDHPNIVRYNSTWIETPPEGWQAEADYEMSRRFGSSHFTVNCSNKAMFIYIQMQLCEYSLADWMKGQSHTSRDIPRMVSWFKQIASAVAYMHSKNLSHRDLKPSNILFVEKDILKICDLGIVNQFKFENGQEVAETLTSTGTALYMAPEQGGFVYKSTVDVFTLGLILAEMCIVMTDDQRKKIFAEYRCGIQGNRLQNQPRLNNFISLLTQVDYRKRPTSRDILQNPFLQ
ncbi:hypothetical protein PMAYCL1PPCAC_08500, partial [Pristionchus mayeri]